MPLVPGGLLATLAVAPRDAPFALLIRHADRAPFPPGEHGGGVGLTAVGEARAAALSRHEVLASGTSVWCESSPLRRCVSTARQLGLTAAPNLLLGEPGAFVTDPVRAGEAFLGLGTEAVVRAHVAGHPWPFMRSPEEGARALLASIAGSLVARRGVGVLVSHDAIVMPVIGWATGDRFEDTWLDPLDGIAVVALGGGALRVLWQGKSFDVTL